MYLFDYIDPTNVRRIDIKEAYEDDLPDEVYAHVHANQVEQAVERFQSYDTIHFKQTSSVWTREDLSIEEFKLRLLIGDYEGEAIFPPEETI